MEIGAFADTCQHLYRSAFFFFWFCFLRSLKRGLNWALAMKPNVEPSLLHVSTHKRIRVYPIFFSRRELTNETTVLITLSSKDIIILISMIPLELHIVSSVDYSNPKDSIFFSFWYMIFTKQTKERKITF